MHCAFLQSLLAPTAFGLGAKYFAFYEEIGVGVQWHNIGVSPAESDSYNLAAVLVMLSIDSVYYGIIFWYIENIHPGKSQRLSELHTSIPNWLQDADWSRFLIFHSSRRFRSSPPVVFSPAKIILARVRN